MYYYYYDYYDCLKHIFLIENDPRIHSPCTIFVIILLFMPKRMIIDLIFVVLMSSFCWKINKEHFFLYSTQGLGVVRFRFMSSSINILLLDEREWVSGQKRGVGAQVLVKRKAKPNKKSMLQFLQTCFLILNSLAYFPPAQQFFATQ